MTQVLLEIIGNAKVHSHKLTCMLLVANSTPIVDLDSRLNSFLVNLESKLLFPTPESPIKTTITKRRRLDHHEINFGKLTPSQLIIRLVLSFTGCLVAIESKRASQANSYSRSVTLRAIGNGNYL